MKRGITMIEVLVYLALYAIVLSGALVSVYTMIESSERDACEARLAEEGNFVLAKLAHLNAHAETVKATENNDGIIFTSSAGDISIMSESRQIMYQDRSRDKEPLIANDVRVSSFTATYEADIQAINVDFTLVGTTAHGVHLEREFSALYPL